MTDSELVEMLGDSDRGRATIGGTTQTVQVAGTSVFAKLVQLTDREGDAGPGCTANLFDLPTWYQYGVGEGSTGFNAWREVATHKIVSDWALDGACVNFPLLYHWRELPHPPPRAAPTDIHDAVRFWGSSPAVEARLRALNESSTVVALFLEHVPLVLRDWLSEQLTAGTARADAAVALVDQQLLGAVAHMRAAGMSHFDAHFSNVLTDGHQIYLSDFGLATAHRFQLSSSEQTFVRLTADHDLAYCATALTNAIATALVGFSNPAERNDYVRRCADAGHATSLGGVVADTVGRYAPVAAAVNDFYWWLHNGDLTAPYPAHRISTALRNAEIPAQQPPSSD